jgi:copper ion binding protein
MTMTVFSVPGMTCGHCKQAVTTEVGKIAGVSSIEVDLDTKKVTVTSSEPLSWSDVVSAIDEAGFEAIAN